MHALRKVITAYALRKITAPVYKRIGNVTLVVYTACNGSRHLRTTAETMGANTSTVQQMVMKHWRECAVTRNSCCDLSGTKMRWNADSKSKLRERSYVRRGVTRGTKFPGRWITTGAPKSPNNVASTFFNTVHLLPKDLRFEHWGAKLASCPGRHLASLRRCAFGKDFEFWVN